MKELCSANLNWISFYFKDTQFVNLMTRRIFNVLLIANPYDAFMLEDDGRVDEKNIQWVYVVVITLPSALLASIYRGGGVDAIGQHTFWLGYLYAGYWRQWCFSIGRHIKACYSHLPIVVLTPFSHGITKRIANEDLSAFDYIFCWLGNTDLLPFHYQTDWG